jgi:Domain of unknown function (DUF4203)
MTGIDLPTLGTNGILIVSLVAIVLGLLNCFFGYRLFKILLGIYGFVLGAIFGAVIAGGLASGNTIVMIVAALAGGLLGAGLMVAFYFLGVFVVGAVAGALLAGSIGTALGVDLPTFVVIIVAIIVGLVALALQKIVIVLATAFSGAWLVIDGGMALISGRAVFLTRAVNAPNIERVTQLSLPVLILWLALGIAGALVQFLSGRRRPAPRPQPEPERPTRPPQQQ